MHLTDFLKNTCRIFVAPNRAAGMAVLLVLLTIAPYVSAQHHQHHHAAEGSELSQASTAGGENHSAGNGWDFFTNYGMYMPRTHCLMTEAGTPDWPWIIALAVLNVGVIAAYLRIFWFWRKSYLQEKEQDRNRKMMDLALIFLWCAVCGYGMSLIIFVWPAYRLLAVCLAVLCFVAWRFLWNLEDLGVSISAKRLQRELNESRDEQLKITTERLRLGLEVARGGEWDWNVQTGDVDYSDRFMTLFGYPVDQDELKIGFWEKNVHPDDWDNVQAKIREHFEQNTEDYRCEYRLRNIDGEYVWTLACGRLVSRTEDGKPLRMQGINFDISDQKSAEAKLRENENAFRGAFEQAAVGIAHVALDGAWIRVNQKICEILGYTQEELMKLRFQDITHPEDLDADLLMVQRVLNGEIDTYTLEKRYVAKSHEMVWANLTVSLIRDDDQNPQYFVSVVEDINGRKLSEAALAESEERFELAMRGANDGLWDWDIQTNNIYYSPRWKSMLGYEEYELEGVLDTATELIHSEDRGPLFETLDEYFAGDAQGFEVECRMKHKDGTYVDILSKAIIVRDQNGVAVRAVGTHTDMTQSKRDAHEIEQFKSTLDRIDDNVLMFWPDSLCLFYVNQGACESMGYTADEMAKMTILDLMAEFDEAGYRNKVASLVSGEQHSMRFETCHRHKDGTEIPFEVFIQYVAPDGEPPRFCAIARDITQQKQVMADLEIAKQEAESASRSKSEFLASMSHELRTPLNGVIGMTELLRATGLDARQKRFVDACHSSGNSLLLLINDILDISKIEAGKLELDDHEFSIQQCVDDTVTMMAGRAHADGLELNYQIDPEVRHAVRGDSVRLRQILVNLLGNAIKFTDDGQVLLRAVLDDQNDDELTVRFSVTDTGPGIAADKLGRLFKSFSQADRSTTRRYGGSGLGLSICKSLAEAMGGRVGIESEVGTGSTFWFTARFDRDPDAEDTPTWLPDDLRGLSVLVVDDNPTSRDILRRTFESWDTDVEVVASDDPFLNSMKSGWSGPQVFDLVVIDMPVTGEATGSPANLAIQWATTVASKLLVLTPVNSEFTPDQLDDSVSYRCLRKPPSPSELLNAITDLFCSEDDQQAMRQQTQTPSQQAAASEWPSLTGKVLLAEDHPTNQMYVCELLRRAGLDVEVASNGLEAVDAVATAAGTEHPFDVVLMDCQMPEMDGFDATKAIREVEEARGADEHIPIVALTAGRGYENWSTRTVSLVQFERIRL